MIKCAGCTYGNVTGNDSDSKDENLQTAYKNKNNNLRKSMHLRFVRSQ